VFQASSWSGARVGLLLRRGGLARVGACRDLGPREGGLRVDQGSSHFSRRSMPGRSSITRGPVVSSRSAWLRVSCPPKYVPALSTG
jgi:hypothetical protein